MPNVLRYLMATTRRKLRATSNNKMHISQIRAPPSHPRPIFGSFRCSLIMYVGASALTLFVQRVSFRGGDSVGMKMPGVGRAEVPSRSSLRPGKRAREVSGLTRDRAGHERYFREQQYRRRLPKPRAVHQTLKDDGNAPANGKNAFVVGDIHGCLDKFNALLGEAQNRQNNGRPFRAVLSVGDLTAKGPNSVDILRAFRDNPNWHAVRGNNDDGTLKAALGDEERLSQEKYAQFVHLLTDEDVEYLAEMPYTLSIPASYFRDEEWEKTDWDKNLDNGRVLFLVVHAGFIPGVPIKNQNVGTMITVREVQRFEESGPYSYYHTRREILDGELFKEDPEPLEKLPWAQAWMGPERVIFGHDASRGLQKTDHAIGLDTGAVYGGTLTGVILPEGRLVSVNMTGKCINVDV
mmetsp:Transcript_42450/g.128815  ORF Transcript_42450/g.128815 Transcript_42450/m.128815 type:complete len:407 (-) Transcript_42450:1027-2247(-)